MWENMEFVIHRTIGGMYRILLFGLEVDQVYERGKIEEVIYHFCAEQGIDFHSSKIVWDL